jgi:hypothetical protein
MTTLNLRHIKGDFLVTGPDIEPRKFKTRREAKARLSRTSSSLPSSASLPARSKRAVSCFRLHGGRDRKIPTPEPGEDAATSWSEVID